MNTELLKTFIEVSKTRHFGRAADNLYVTQSAVSFRIRQLEDLLGVPLFERQRNNILLTDAGERLLPHAENLVSSWHSAMQDVGATGNKDIQIAFGSTSNLWDTFLQSLLPKVATTFSGIKLRTETSTNQDLTRALLGGRIDIAILLDPPQVAEFKQAKIGEIKLVLVSNQKPQENMAIAELGHIFVDWGTTGNFQQASIFKDPLAPILHTRQSHIALEFLKSFGGAAFLPRAMVQTYLDEHKLFMVPDVESFTHDVYAIFNQSSGKLGIISAIVALLKDEDLKPASAF